MGDGILYGRSEGGSWQIRRDGFEGAFGCMGDGLWDLPIWPPCHFSLDESVTRILNNY